MDTIRSNLYQALAEALAEPPDWLALPGVEWPLFEAALQLAPESVAVRRAVIAMMEIGGESIEEIREQYEALFAGPGRPRVWIYESGALSGRLFTETTLEVERWYRETGLNIIGAELPDHASLELAFLASMASNSEEEFSRIEQGFLRSHACRWLPALGHALVFPGDNRYALIGQLLADWMEELNSMIQMAALPHEKSRLPSRRLPALHEAAKCSLCSFCVQACPARAFAIFEDQQTTSLLFSAARCMGCGKCLQVCPEGVLSLEITGGVQKDFSGWVKLRESPRSVCRKCGALLVSQAELHYIAECLGKPTWLELCQDCRDGFQ